MPNRLPVPDALQHLIEKRESDRRASDQFPGEEDGRRQLDRRQRQEGEDSSAPALPQRSPQRVPDPFTPEQKAAILQRHLLDQVPVSELCVEYGIDATRYNAWQKQLFDGAAMVFARSEVMSGQ